MYSFIVRNCNIGKIKESGQCFRIRELAVNSYLAISSDKACRVIQDRDDIGVICYPEEINYWLNYFDESVFGDKSVDYEMFEYRCIFDSSNFIRDSAIFGKGLRLLNQDPYECLVSFIISQRKSIPAITKCIDSLCSHYGDEKSFDAITYYTFPSPQKLVEGYERDKYTYCSLGYRAEYIYELCKLLSKDKMNLEYLRVKPYDIALSELKTLRGVGDKVANCTLLYSLGFKNAFPRDVWINRILNNYFSNNSFPFDRYEGVLGILQLYMFYFVRYNKDLSF